MTLVLGQPTIAFRRFDVSLLETEPPLVQFADLHSGLGNWVERGFWHQDDAPEICLINSLEEGYVVLLPIPVQISRSTDGTYLASFEEANIAIGGADPQDAYQSLVAEILDTIDTLIDEPRLSPPAAAQLQVLRNYVFKSQRPDHA
jgi:hypothetical protein